LKLGSLTLAKLKLVPMSYTIKEITQTELEIFQVALSCYGDFLSSRATSDSELTGLVRKLKAELAQSNVEKD